MQKGVGSSVGNIEHLRICLCGFMHRITDACVFDNLAYKYRGGGRGGVTVREYIFSVIGAALIVTAVSLFLPEGGISKYVRLLASFCALCTIVSPAFGLASGLDIFSLVDLITEDDSAMLDAEKKYYDILTELQKEELEIALSELVCEKFGIKKDDIKINVDAREKDGVFCAERVRVGLFFGAVIKNPYDIENYVESLVGCDCDTYY
jgi:hypothetical protein